MPKMESAKSISIYTNKRKRKETTKATPNGGKTNQI